MKKKKKNIVQVHDEKIKPNKSLISVTEINYKLTISRTIPIITIK
jgi:hypothetical protein